ncbi:hypothetical protein NQT62_03070 [Limnobacter humi]|uniref:Uncharacterized protein n=1 Tax=Limnobacter humi TaxID=1778671 RepID=A0ABT1WG75_9BURK|nr:hypothetical protein [Limnobacter humi]MCQ8895419.1 hypothetical protein [Limnobacter humi]
MMNWLILGGLGLLLGILLSVWLINRLLKVPTTRVWLSDWANWSNNQIPDGCYQMVRHGKWVAHADHSEDA